MHQELTFLQVSLQIRENQVLQFGPAGDEKYSFFNYQNHNLKMK